MSACIIYLPTEREIHSTQKGQVNIHNVVLLQAIGFHQKRRIQAHGWIHMCGHLFSKSWSSVLPA